MMMMRRRRNGMGPPPPAKTPGSNLTKKKWRWGFLIEVCFLGFKVASFL